MKKRSSKASSFSFVVFGLFLLVDASLALAKAAPSRTISTQEILSHYEEMAKKQPLAVKDAEVYKLLQISEQVFKVESYTVYGSSSNPNSSFFAQVDSQRISMHMTKKISEGAMWEQELSKEKLRRILSDDTLLKKAFGERSYGWAWCLKIMGQESRAKDLLQSLYDLEYDKLLKLKRVVIGLRGKRPNQLANQVFRAYKTLGNKTEIQNMERRQHKVKVHLSNLPESHVVT